MVLEEIEVQVRRLERDTLIDSAAYRHRLEVLTAHKTPRLSARDRLRTFATRLGFRMDPEAVETAHRAEAEKEAGLAYARIRAHQP